MDTFVSAKGFQDEGNLRRRHNFTVALFGYYRYRNFGDDLMAVIVGDCLVRAGFRVVVYGLSPEDSFAHGFTSCSDIESLVKSADAVVLGGGGLYLKHASPWPNVVSFYQELQSLLSICRQREIPMYGISLGGSGHTELWPWQKSALEFTQIAKLCTFRNPVDKAINDLCGRRDFRCHSDIVWLANDLVNPVARRERPRIIVNIGAHKYGSLGRMLTSLLLSVLERQTDADVWYLDGTRDRNASFAVAKPKKLSLHSKLVRIDELVDGLSDLADCDLVITTRLHVGVSAMSYGVPMVSFLGEEKAQILLDNLGLRTNIVTPASVPRLLWRIAKYSRWNTTYRGVSKIDRQRLQDDARVHLSDLIESLDSAALAAPSKGV